MPEVSTSVGRRRALISCLSSIALDHEAEHNQCRSIKGPADEWKPGDKQLLLTRQRAPRNKAVSSCRKDRNYDFRCRKTLPLPNQVFAPASPQLSKSWCSLRRPTFRPLIPLAKPPPSLLEGQLSLQVYVTAGPAASWRTASSARCDNARPGSQS